MAAASRIRCLGSAHRRDFCECAVPVRPGRSWHWVDYRVVCAPGGVMEGVSMVFMTNVLSGFFFVAFSYWLVTARTGRQVLAAVLAAGLLPAPVGPPQAWAPGNRLAASKDVSKVNKGPD